MPSSFVAGGGTSALVNGALPFDQRQQRNVESFLKNLKFENASEADDVDDGTGNKAKRDVRLMQKFIEIALVIDKAMVRDSPCLPMYCYIGLGS